MDTIRTLIVDDEPLARHRLRSLLEGRDGYRIVGECGTAQGAIESLKGLEPDLLFLDVQMPEIGGFEILGAVDPERLPVVIFVTAYDEYAVRAFEVHALDYLLKPFADERFEEALERAEMILDAVNGNGSRARLRALLDQPSDPESVDDGTEAAASSEPNGGRQREDRYLERLVVKTGDRIFFQKVEEIDWFEAADYYVKLHVGAQSHLIRESLKRLETQLDPQRFSRIHRSAIVNLDRVKELQPWFHGAYLVLLEDGTELRLSRARRKTLEATLGRPL
jgi:two-component system LytT family response regulator